MVILALKYSQELVPFFSYINGILDYIEGFNDENLHKVYEIFSYLALSGRSNSDSVCSSIANELLIIVRKQVSNPDLKYKKMGLIGTLKIVSRLGDTKNATQLSIPQRTDCEESLELLRMALDSCKSFPLPLIMFYDELIALLERTSLQPALMEWIGRHAGDFESIFLSDLEGGQLLSKGSFCGLEGELWMNLDGDLSPICLNILPLVSSSLQCSSSLQILPAYFLLLSVVERATNQGSLGGIDALLGCPLWLPSHKYFGETVWSSLTAKQKQAMCLSIYYASNWIRELLNAFCTQVIGENDCISQATKDELISKLSKRLRNLVVLESLLDTSLKLHPLSLPELHLLAERSGSSSGKPSLSMNMEKKNEKSTISQSNSSNKKLKRKISSQSANDKMKQPTILEMLKRAGAVSQEVPNDGLSDHSGKSTESQYEETPPSTSSPCFIEISAATRVLDGQRFKCRSLSIDSLSFLTFSTAQDTCCADPTAELSLHLYLLRDLCHKLESLTPQTKLTPAGSLRTPFSNRLIVHDFVNKIRQLLPFLRKHFDCAVSVLNMGDDTCGEHWNTQSVAAGNPDIPGLVVSKTVVAGLVFKEVLSCLGKMLNLPDIRMNVPVLSDLLKAFQPIKISESFLSAVQPIPSPGNMDYLYCGAYAFFEGVLDTACSSSVMMASEVLVTLESIVNSAKYFLDKLLEGSGKSMHIGFVQKVIPILRNRLGSCAHKLLTSNWDSENIENGCKTKGETIQKMVHIYFENSESTADLLEEFVCSVLSQAPSSKTQSTTQDAIHGFPTLCPTTFLVWYRASYEENHSILNKLVKEVSVLEKSRTSIDAESVKKLLKKLHQSVNVVVSLVNMCKTHDKVAVHAMAVKYGGKFVDTFLKVFDFLQAHFGEHSEVIILLVKELQKATRTIQTLCSEAKGCKRTMITSKIPATKRSMERFLFGVKALLYSTSNGGNFWMGNLKHKDLYGQVVSSQVYAGGDDVEEGEENDPMDQDVEEAVSIASQHDDEEEAEPYDE